MRTILFRADASAVMGSGHLMRLMALAQAHRERGGAAVFVLSKSSSGIELLARRGLEPFQTNSAAGTAAEADEVDELAARFGADAVVIDGYHFDAHYLARLGRDRCMIVIDDLADRAIAADIIVNPGYGAERLCYRTKSGARLLTGPDYALLRSEFTAHPAAPREHHEVAAPLRLLVSFGASDPTRATARVLAQLPSLRAIVARVIVGADYCDDGELAAAAAQAASRGHIIELARDVRDMPWMMATADAAVTAAGATLWELAYMGLPAMAFAVAENQAATAARLAASGHVDCGGWLSAMDDAALTAALTSFFENHARRATLAERLAALVDGRGPERILTAIDFRCQTRSRA